MPFFSTIIPVYNRGELVRQTLDSVLEQEFDDQEVIVVDDGSTDDTLKVLEAYGSRIKVLRQANQGPGIARNLGIEHARGSYITVFDSDDVWFPWTLSTYREAIERHGGPAFVAGRPRVFHSVGELQAIEPQPLQSSAFPDYLASGDAWRWFGASSFVLNAEEVRRAGGFSRVRISSDDADLALKLGVAPGFVQITAPHTFGYREHPSSLKANLPLALCSAHFLLAQEAGGHYPGGLGRAKQRQRILARALRPLTLELLARGEKSEAISIFKAMLSWNLSDRRARFIAAFISRVTLGRFSPI